MPFRILGISAVLLMAIVAGSNKLAAQTPSSGSVVVPITVNEASGVNRTNDPVTSGVPIPLSATQSQWALFDGATEIPVQTTLLPGMKAPWLLLDFQSTVAANTAHVYTLKEQAPTAAPTDAVTVSQNSSTITVTTGPIRTQLSLTDFNVFDDVWLDRNGDRSYTAGELVISPSGTSNISVNDAGTGLTFSGRGVPTAVTWEYQGPMRATLRIDGDYKNGGTTLLNYTTRITWYAGQAYVRVEQLIRNSYAPQERYVKLSSAKLNLGTLTTTKRIDQSGSSVWTNVTTTSYASIELIPPTLVVSTAYDPSAVPPIDRVNSNLDVDANGGMIIGDMSYHGATIQADFSEGVSVGQKSQRATIFADPLIAVASSAWYSDQGAFGQDHFSTYDDEKNANTTWGWTWPTPGNLLSQEHNRPRVPTYYPSWSVLDSSNDPESDDLWENMVMYSRVQIPFYLDRLRGWARYWKWEWTFRTDGFAYNGAWEDFWDGPTQVHRTPVIEPALTAADSAYINHDIKHGKAGVSHMWNGGMIDDFYLTGDRDAYAAAIDTAEQCQKRFEWQVAGTTSSQVGGNARFQGRCLLIFDRTWEMTNDPQWKAAADHVIQILLQSITYDQRGFFYGTIADLGPDYVARFPGNSKDIVPFMMTTVVEGLYRYYLLTNNASVRTMILQMAQFDRDHGIDPVTQYGGDYIVMDSPNPGDIKHASYSQFRGTTPNIPYTVASSTEGSINAMVIAYRLTADPSFLQQAKYYWNQGSKRDYVAPYTQHFATDTQVGKFALSLQAWDANSLLYPEGGDWLNVSYLFYEAARADWLAPSSITNLGVSN